MSTPDTPAASPVIEVHGPATPEDVAAVVAVLTALGGGTTDEDAVSRSPWNTPESMLRRPVHPGRGVWRGSLRSS